MAKKGMDPLFGKQGQVQTPVQQSQQRQQHLKPEGALGPLHTVSSDSLDLQQKHYQCQPYINQLEAQGLLVHGTVGTSSDKDSKFCFSQLFIMQERASK